MSCILAVIIKGERRRRPNCELALAENELGAINGCFAKILHDDSQRLLGYVGIAQVLETGMKVT